MSTKGASNRYGNKNGRQNLDEKTDDIAYPWAKGFLGSNASSHFKDHGKELGINKLEDYIASAVHFANKIDRKHFRSVVNYKKETYKYDPDSKLLVVVTKEGFIRTFYSTKGSGGFSYYPKKGIKVWIKV